MISTIIIGKDFKYSAGCRLYLGKDFRSSSTCLTEWKNLPWWSHGLGPSQPELRPHPVMAPVIDRTVYRCSRDLSCLHPL